MGFFDNITSALSWAGDKINKYGATAITHGAKIVKTSLMAAKGAFKAIPIVGNAIGVVDDLVQDYKIGQLRERADRLEEAKIGLQKSTSLLNG